MYSKFLLVFLIFPLSLLAQEKGDSLALQLAQHLEIYEKLYPDESIYRSSDIGSTLDEELYADDKDEIDAFTAISFYGDEIHQTMEKMIQLYSFEEIMHFNQSGIAMKISDDRRLFNYSISEKAGGTFQTRDSKSFYCTEDGVLYDVSGITNDGIAEIHTIETPLYTKYLLLEFTQSCTSCQIQKVQLLHFEEGNNIPDFEYAMQNREGSLQIDYDEVKKRIQITYTTDDFQSYCDCEQVASWDKRTYIENDKDAQEICLCTFQFNGETFDLITEEK